MDNLVNYLTLLILLASGVHILRVFKGQIQPYIIMVAGLFLAILFNVFQLLTPIATSISVLSLRVQSMFLAFSTLTSIGLVVFLRRRPRSPDGGRGINRRAVQLIGWCCLFISVVELILVIRMVGTLPLFKIADNAGTGYGVQYSEVQIPFLTMFSRACGRLFLVLMSAVFIFSRQSLTQFAKSYLVELLILLTVLLFNLAAGNRSVILIAVLIMGSAVSLRVVVPRKILAILGVILIVVFVVVGNFRFGQKDIRRNLEFQSGISAVDYTLAWFSNYTQPNPQNLEIFMYLNGSYKSWGKLIISKCIPDQILNVVYPAAANVQDTALLMEGEGKQFFAQPGMMFTTAFSQFYQDFGGVGSVLFLSGLCVLSMHACAQSTRNPAWAIFFLYSIPGVALVFAQNNFATLPNLLPLTMLPFARYLFPKNGRPRKQIIESHSPLAEALAQSKKKTGGPSI